MMKAYKCDMCGKIILGNDVSYSLAVWKQQGSMSDEMTMDIDLCPECMARTANVLGQTSNGVKFMGEN